MPPKVKVPNITCEEIVSKCSCPHCQQVFTCQKGLTKHINQVRCQVLRDQIQEQNYFEKFKCTHEEQMKHEIRKGIEALKEDLLNDIRDNQMALLPYSQAVNNNNLNVMCLGSNDDLLQILTSRSDIVQALTMIKDSALGKLAADCRILERIYFPENMKPAIMYANTAKTQFVYYDEKKNRVVESSAKVIAKKLAGNLQCAYLKSFNEFRRDRRDYDTEAEWQCHKNRPTLEAYDKDVLNTHIQRLQDDRYQKKILIGMKIPFETDVISK